MKRRGASGRETFEWRAAQTHTRYVRHREGLQSKTYQQLCIRTLGFVRAGRPHRNKNKRIENIFHTHTHAVCQRVVGVMFDVLVKQLNPRKLNCFHMTTRTDQYQPVSEQEVYRWIRFFMNSPTS